MSTFTEHLTLGERLARARTFAEMSQTELAEKLGITRKSVFNYETDHRTPSFAIVCAWSAASGVPLAYFADATIADGKTASNTWYRAGFPGSVTDYQPSNSDVIDLTRPFPHAVPVECDGQFELPLPDSCTYVLNSEHALLDRAA